MSWLKDTLEVARQASILVVRTRSFLLLLGLCVVAGVGMSFVAGRVASHVPGTEFYGMIITGIFFQVGLPFAAVYYGVAAIHGELADRTATHLFVRRLHRSSLYLGKWLAVLFVGSLVSAFGMAAIYLGVSLPELPWTRGLAPNPEHLGIFVVVGILALGAYAAVGVCFGALFKRPLVGGIAFVLCWEFMVSHTPPQAGVRGMTVADPIRRLLFAWLEPKGELRENLMRDLDPSWLIPGKSPDF